VGGDEHPTFQIEALTQGALPHVYGVGVKNRRETVIENDLFLFHELILTKVQISKNVCRRSDDAKRRRTATAETWVVS
jgi:hypothetical protein